MAKIIFLNNTAEKINGRIFGGLVKKWRKQGIISLVILSNKEIQKLNKKFRGKNKPTDVLSFEYDDKDIKGEIFIAMGTAKRQAKEKKHSLKKELEILFVHGLLHVYGYDHNNDEEEAEMEKAAGKIL